MQTEIDICRNLDKDPKSFKPITFILWLDIMRRMLAAYHVANRRTHGSRRSRENLIQSHFAVGAPSLVLVAEHAHALCLLGMVENKCQVQLGAWWMLCVAFHKQNRQTDSHIDTKSG